MDEVPVFFLVTREFEAIRRQERVLYEPQRLGPNSQGFGLGWCTLHLRGETIERFGSNSVVTSFVCNATAR